MRAVTVYRLEDVSNFSYHTRHPIGSVLEMRIYEWDRGRPLKRSVQSVGPAAHSRSAMSQNTFST
jgi:hypothetical protein